MGEITKDTFSQAGVKKSTNILRPENFVFFILQGIFDYSGGFVTAVDVCIHVFFFFLQFSIEKWLLSRPSTHVVAILFTISRVLPVKRVVLLIEFNEMLLT